MDVEIFTLCDAQNEGGGKINLFGIFDTINSNSVPCRHNQLTLVLRVRFNEDEGTDHSFKISIMNPSNLPVIPPFEGKVKSIIGENKFPGRVNVFIQLAQLTFESFGVYCIILEIDGKEIQKLPLLLKKKIDQVSNNRG